MNFFKALLFVCLVVPGWTWSAVCAQAQERAVTVEAAGRQKWAFIFGSNSYADRRLGKLSHCGDDLAAMEDLLVQYGGYARSRVFVFHDKRPEINQWPMRRVLEDTFKAFVALPGPEDQVLVVCSSHGTEVDGVTYLCPMDADPDKPALTMLRVSWLYEMLDLRCKAAQKIVILDACRNPAQGRTRGAEVRPMSRGFADSIRNVPRGLLVLSSCVSGQVSYEAPALGHGVFLHFVMQGLSGKADNRELNPHANGDGQVDVPELFSFAAKESAAYVAKTFNAQQTPEKYGKETYPPIVLTGRPVTSGPIEFEESKLGDADRCREAIALARVAVAKAEEGDVGMALAAFETAVEMASGIRLEGLKDGTIFEIAKARADAKDFDGAVNTAKLIKDPARLASTLLYVAKAQADANAFEDALRTLEMIDDKAGKDGALERIATSQTNIKEFNGALLTANSIVDKLRRYRMVSRIAVAQAEAGLTTDASVSLKLIHTAAGSEYNYSRSDEETAIYQLWMGTFNEISELKRNRGR